MKEVNKVISYILFPVGVVLALIAWVLLEGPDMGWDWMRGKLRGGKP